MKRILFSTAFMLLLVMGTWSTAMAQEGAKVGFRLSPLISWGTITVDSTKTKPTGLETSAALGFSFDFVFTYGFTDNIGFKTGINIATKSIKSTTTLGTPIGGVSELDSKMSFTTVEVPIGLKFRSPEIGDGIYIYGVFGANAEFNIQNKMVADEIVTTVDSNQVVTVSVAPGIERRDVDGVNLFTASFAPGAGVDWQFDWGMLEFGGTFNLGLLSYTNKNDANFDEIITKLKSIQLNIGYYF
jgi:hypothetical protein